MCFDNLKRNKMVFITKEQRGRQAGRNAYRKEDRRVNRQAGRQTRENACRSTSILQVVQV